MLESSGFTNSSSQSHYQSNDLVLRQLSEESLRDVDTFSLMCWYDCEALNIGKSLAKVLPRWKSLSKLALRNIGNLSPGIDCLLQKLTHLTCLKLIYLTVEPHFLQNLLHVVYNKCNYDGNCKALAAAISLELHNVAPPQQIDIPVDYRKKQYGIKELIFSSIRITPISLVMG